MMAVVQQDPLSSNENQLLEREFALRIGWFVVAMYGNNRRNGAELIQYPQWTDVACVQDQMGIAEYIAKGSGQRREALGHMRVRNDPQTGLNQFRCQLWWQKPMI